MPRVRVVSNVMNSAKSIKGLTIQPSHITVFCQQRQGDSLLNPFVDFERSTKQNQIQKIRSKVQKTYKKLQVSARQSYNIALSSNQIRCSDKCFVLNKNLLIENQNHQNNNVQLQKEITSQYLKNPSIQQKIHKVFETIKPKYAESIEELRDKWILEDDSHSSSNILADKYQLLFSPSIIYGKQLETRYEECMSFPFIDFMIPRYNKLLIHYYDQNIRSQFLYTSGFASRVIQHHCELLEGRIILDWRINHGQFNLNASVSMYFFKSQVVIEEYFKALKQIFKNFPQLNQTRKQYVLQQKKLQKLLDGILQQTSQTSSTQTVGKRLEIKKSSKKEYKKILSENNNTNFSVNKYNQLEQLSFEDDYLTRIVKHYKKQFAKFNQKIEVGLINLEELNKNKNQHLLTGKDQSNQDQLMVIQEVQQFNQKEYSKSIKIKFVGKDKTTNNLKINQKIQQNTDNSFNEQGLQISDEQVDKLLAKRKKSKKKK